MSTQRIGLFDPSLAIDTYHKDELSNSVSTYRSFFVSYAKIALSPQTGCEIWRSHYARLSASQNSVTAVTASAFA